VDAQSPTITLAFVELSGRVKTVPDEMDLVGERKLHVPDGQKSR